MKKALSIILSVLVLISCVSVISLAAEEAQPQTYKITFYNDDKTILHEEAVKPGGIVKLPVTAPVCSQKPTIENSEFKFLGWARCDVDADGEIIVYDSVLYDAYTIPNATADANYIAVFSNELYHKETQSFFQFIKSVFERINQLFKYFFDLFGWDKE